MNHDSRSREQLEARLASAEAELGDLRERASAGDQWSVAVALDRMNEGFLFLDQDSRVTFANPVAELLVRKSRAELIGRSLWEAFPEASSLHFGREYRRAVAENVPVDFEEFYPEPLNAWYHVRAYPSAEGLSILFSDITERKQAEEALRERTKELACLYGIADLIESDNSLEKILQGTPDLMPRGWCYIDIACARIVLNGQEFATADFRKTAWSQASDIMLLGKPAGMVELCYLEERPIRDEGPFLREERALINAIAQRLGRLAERKQAESALRASDDRHRAMLKTVMSGFWLADLQGRLLEVNDAYCGMSGYSAQELLAMRIFDLEAAETTDETAGHILALKAQGENRFESRHRRKDGSTYDVEISVQYLPIEDGRFLGFLRDISDRKRAEQQIERARNDAVREKNRLEAITLALSGTQAALRDANVDLLVANEALRLNNETLEARVATRTADLAHRTSQLQALARDLAQAEERERQRIAQVIHDQLQQLLSVARIKLGMAVGQVPAESNQQSLGEVDDLIAESLEITRSLTAELSPAILYRSGLGAALRWLGRSYGARFALTIAVDAEEDVDVEEEVRVTLFRSVRELLFNVVKHARVTSARVRLERGADGGVRIVVSDDGVGFDPEAVRAREGTDGSFGLFSLRERLEQLGGRLEVESAPGGGASFTIVAPLVEPVPPEASAPAAASAAPRAVAVGRPTGARHRPARTKTR